MGDRTKKRQLLRRVCLSAAAAADDVAADENSAAANSFKTIQHLSGSNFLRLLFGLMLRKQFQ